MLYPLIPLLLATLTKTQLSKTRHPLHSFYSHNFIHSIDFIHYHIPFISPTSFTSRLITTNGIGCLCPVSFYLLLLRACFVCTCLSPGLHFSLSLHLSCVLRTVFLAFSPPYLYSSHSRRLIPSPLFGLAVALVLLVFFYPSYAVRRFDR